MPTTNDTPYLDDSPVIEPGSTPDDATVINPQWLTLTWTHTDSNPAGALRCFRLVVYKGTNPNTTSNYIVPPVEVPAALRAAVVPVRVAASVTVYAAVQAVYYNGNESSWRVISGSIVLDPDTVSLADLAGVTAVLVKITAITSDDVLSTSEKSYFNLVYTTVTQEQSSIDSQATAFAAVSAVVTAKNSYDISVTQLTDHVNSLSPAFTDTTQDTPLGTGGGATLRTKFASVFANREGLLKVVAEAQKAASDRADEIARDANNLIKNGNSEDGAPVGVDAVGVFTAGAGAYSGTKVKKVDTVAGYGAYYITGLLPCSPGDAIHIEGQAKMASGTGSCRVGFQFQDAAGANKGWDSQHVSNPASTYGLVTADGTAPAGTTRVSFYLEISSASAGAYGYFDALKAEKKQTGIVAAEDPDTLWRGEKPIAIQEYNALVAENANLVSKANNASVSHTTYDAAYTALVTTYLPGLNTSNPTKHWDDTTTDTPLTTGGRASNWIPKWNTLESESANLKAAIAEAIRVQAAAAKTNADSALANAPISVASFPTLPNVAYPAGRWVWNTTNNTLRKVNAAGTGWDLAAADLAYAVGSIVAGQISAGAIGATALAATIIMTSYIGSSDYTQDGTGKPLTGWKLDSAETTYKLKVGYGWFGTAIKIGSGTFTLGDTSGRTLTGIASSGLSAADVIWWRGNNDTSINGGAPIIIDPLWALDRTPDWAVGDRCISGPPSTSAATYANGRYVYECTTAGADLSTAQATSAAWSGATTYALGNTVTNSSHAYISKQNSNLNHSPTIGGDAWWTDLGLTYGIVGTLRATDSYISGLAKFKCVGFMYTRVNSNLSGCRGWTRSLAYGVGELVCSDVTATAPGYIADNSKLYGQPSGSVYTPTSTYLNYGGTRIYRCVTAGTSSASGNGPSGTGVGITDGTAVWDYWAENTGPEDRVQIWETALDSAGCQIEYEFRIQPKTNKDNLDALTHLELDYLGYDDLWKGRSSGVHPQLLIHVPSRKYYSASTPAHIGNMVRVTTAGPTGSVNQETGYYFNAAPYGGRTKFRVKLHNVQGSSSAVEYGNWADQNISPSPYTNVLASPPSGGGGGGGGGSSCPEGWVLIKTTRGEVRADEIVEGDEVITREETNGEPGTWPVISVLRDTNETAMVELKKTTEEGDVSVVELAFALNHKFVRKGVWTELRDLQPGSEIESTDGSKIHVVSVNPRGINDVIKITVDVARTYSTSGVLSHNIKILD